MKVYVVQQRFGDNIEDLRAFCGLVEAQDFCHTRAGVSIWKEHNSHGLVWASLNGDGVYFVIEMELHGLVSQDDHDNLGDSFISYSGKAEERIMVLEAALEKYGRHTFAPNKRPCLRAFTNEEPCICGLDAAKQERLVKS